MSRRSVQMRKVANSGPIVEVRTDNGTVFLRSRKDASAFASTLPHNMKPEKRARIMAAHYPKS